MNITRKFSSLVTINFEVKFAVNSHHCGTLKSDFLYAMFVVNPPPNSHAPPTKINNIPKNRFSLPKFSLRTKHLL